MEWLKADVRKGTKRDAILHSVGANSAHGLPRTNDDKRRAVQMLLADPEWSQWSDREIGRRCAVGHELVGKARPSLAVTTSEKTYTNKHGTESTMKTENIGRAQGQRKDYGTTDERREQIAALAAQGKRAARLIAHASANRVAPSGVASVLWFGRQSLTRSAAARPRDRASGS